MMDCKNAEHRFLRPNAATNSQITLPDTWVTRLAVGDMLK